MLGIIGDECWEGLLEPFLVEVVGWRDNDGQQREGHEGLEVKCEDLDDISSS